MENVAGRPDILDSEALESRMSRELAEFVLDLERKRETMELVDGENVDDDDKGWKIYNQMKDNMVANKNEKEKDDDDDAVENKIEVPYYITIVEQVIEIILLYICIYF